MKVLYAGVVALALPLSQAKWCTSKEVHVRAYSDPDCTEPMRFYENPHGCGKGKEEKNFWTGEKQGGEFGMMRGFEGKKFDGKGEWEKDFSKDSEDFDHDAYWAKVKKEVDPTWSQEEKDEYFRKKKEECRKKKGGRGSSSSSSSSESSSEQEAEVVVEQETIELDVGPLSGNLMESAEIVDNEPETEVEEEEPETDDFEQEQLEPQRMEEEPPQRGEFEGKGRGRGRPMGKDWDSSSDSHDGRGRGKGGRGLMHDECLSVFTMGESHCNRNVEARCVMIAEGVWQKAECEHIPKDCLMKLFGIIAMVLVFCMVCCCAPVYCKRQNEIARKLDLPGPFASWKNTFCCCCRRRSSMEQETELVSACAVDMPETTDGGVNGETVAVSSDAYIKV